MSELPPISVGDLGKPADTLVKKVSAGLGGFFQPRFTVKQAKAEAEAAIIKARAAAEVALIQAQSGIDIKGLERRGIMRVVAEEAQNQQAIETITTNALPQLTAGATPEKIDDDWMTAFLAKCRHVRTAEMQAMWSKILAGEANAPGTYAKRTLDFLQTLDRNDAENFRLLMRFRWLLDDALDPIVFDIRNPIYENNGLNFNTILHLDSIGLIKYHTGMGFYARTDIGQEISVAYHVDGPIRLCFKKAEKNELDIGRVLLTKVGQQLASLCEVEPIEGFDNYVLCEWIKLTPELRAFTEVVIDLNSTPSVARVPFRLAK